jgi:hypothetical protein
MALRYRLLTGHSGRGQLVNISSSGLLFRSGATFHTGDLIEIEIAWPAVTDRGERVVLRVHGWIVRSNEAGTAIRISKYEFRGYSALP